MSDTQFGILITTLISLAGGFFGTIKWAVGRITKSMDDSTTARDTNTTALVRVATKVDDIHDWMLGEKDRFEARNTGTHSGYTAPEGIPIQTAPQEYPIPDYRGGPARSDGAYAEHKRTPPMGNPTVRRPGTKGGGG